MKLALVFTVLLGSALVATTFTTSNERQSSLTIETNLGGVVPPLELPAITSADAQRRPRAHSEPHGHAACASGCVVSHHPTRHLSLDECHDLLAAYQRLPFDQASETLDALLYYGAQTRNRLRNTTLAELLDKQHVQFLKRELSRERVLVAIRLVDQFGTVRAQLPPTAVPQHVRQVFELDVADLQPLLCSGTVKRVGKNHVWQRL